MGSLSTFGIAYAMINIAEPFPDVNYNDYYGNALVNMQERNVISGYADGTFGPNDPVTRAQLVAILDRYDNSLFNANYTSRSNGIMYLLCDGINKEDVKEGYRDFYTDLCEQTVLL